MGVVTLDEKLKKIDLSNENDWNVKSFNLNTDKDRFINNLTDMKVNVDYKNNKKTFMQSQFAVKTDLEGTVYHKNYLSYLEIAWASHFGVKFSPDILWYSLICELASIVKKDAEKYRYLFTDSNEKKNIVVQTDDPVEIPIHLVIGQLYDLVPTDVDIFLPSFSTTTSKARDAEMVAFADMVSPYYNYMMLSCGIPYIEVLGSEKDYLLIGECWNKIAGLFKTHEEYFERVSKTLSDILQNLDNVEFWKKMFYLEKCGSGSQTETYGWFTDLYLEEPKLRYIGNFSTHVSQVEYKELFSQREFLLKTGIFSSKIEDGFLNPDFGKVILEKRSPVTTETQLN